MAFQKSLKIINMLKFFLEKAVSGMAKHFSERCQYDPNNKKEEK